MDDKTKEAMHEVAIRAGRHSVGPSRDVEAGAAFRPRSFHVAFDESHGGDGRLPAMLMDRARTAMLEIEDDGGVVLRHVTIDRKDLGGGVVRWDVRASE